jgi:hypothetical protein
MPGQSQEAGWTVSVTAPIGPVRGLFAVVRGLVHARPWPVLPRSVDRSAPGTRRALLRGAAPVPTKMQSMLGKLGVRNRLQAAVAAYDAGLARPRGS